MKQDEVQHENTENKSSKTIWEWVLGYSIVAVILFIGFRIAVGLVTVTYNNIQEIYTSFTKGNKVECALRS